MTTGHARSVECLGGHAHGCRVAAFDGDERLELVTRHGLVETGYDVYEVWGELALFICHCPVVHPAPWESDA